MPDLLSTSRFRRTPLVIRDGEQVYGPWRQPSWLLTRPKEEDIRRMRVSADLVGRPDKIAELAYGTHRLEWVIIAFNNATTGLNWPPVGATVEWPQDFLVFPELT